MASQYSYKDYDRYLCLKPGPELFLVVFVPVLTGSMHGLHTVGWVQAGLSALIVLHLWTSRRLREAFADFPQETAEDRKGNKA